MDLKKAVFLGGAILLLTACDRATAPDTLVREGGPAAAAKAKAKSPSPNDVGVPAGLFGDCEMGMFYREGRDSTCIPEAP